MRVLLLGAYGLIGAHVLARLHEGAHEIVAIVWPMAAKPDRAPWAG